MMTAISSDRRDEIEYWFWQCNNLILFIPSHFFSWLFSFHLLRDFLMCQKLFLKTFCRWLMRSKMVENDINANMFSRLDQIDFCNRQRVNENTCFFIPGEEPRNRAGDSDQLWTDLFTKFSWVATLSEPLT